jgi:hypothetical protein
MTTRSSHATARAITKSVSIQCDPRDAFTFLSNPENWPKWAVVNIKSVTPTSDPEWWNMTTAHSAGQLRIRANAEFGILDQDFVDAQARWEVPTRVVPNGHGTEFMMTFFQPPSFTDRFFDEQIKLIDIELEQLKKILEAQ